MKVVVKIGGARLLDLSTAVDAIRPYQGDQLILVHGGGTQISRALERMNVLSSFVDGLRVTDVKTLEAVSTTLLGEVHPKLVLLLCQSGIPAVGAFGLVGGEKRGDRWGFVGTNLDVDAHTLNNLVSMGKVPVIPTLALGGSSLLNVNGDETAAAVAIATKADALVFLTDVGGVRGPEGEVLKHGGDPDALAHSSFVSGGMKPKLLAVKAAIDGGVGRVTVGLTLFRKPIRIRPAKPADIPTIFTITAHYAAQDVMLPRSEAAISAALPNYLVAELDGQMAGFGGLHKYSPALAEIFGLATPPGNSNNGAGRAVVRALIERARERKIARVFALTLTPQFFEKLGFHCVPATDLPEKIWKDCLTCPRVGRCNEIAMVLDLETQ